MASRSIPRFKAKLGGFFKSRAEEDRLDSSKYVSTPRKPSRSPQPQGNPAPASQLALQPSTVAPLEVVSASTVTDDVAITGRLPEERSEPAKKSLWDRAYDGLKEENARLVQEYEELLSKELQADGASDDDISDTRPDDGSVKRENQIAGANPELRLEQLEQVASKGLQQLDEDRTRYSIFGHEFILRDRLTQATRFVQNIKAVIDEAVKASSEASLAWAGVCVILPVFMNPSIAEEASRDGCLYVTSRIQYYVKLESLVLSSKRSQESGLDAELEDRLITLYQQIIDFQIRTVRRIYLTRLARFKEDTVRHEDWKGMIARIQASEQAFGNDFKQVNDAAIRGELEALNSNAERFLADINTALVALLRESRTASSSYSFRNEGPGSQFNATGGTQNNVTGNGIQFSGSSFAGPVNFNGK
ncbi:hypothetical protein HDV57DRAFT_509346 [Trichoderma longibrachiatum]|uniref:NWD NACHT-NTPase N-terminal domain-containing protein n=1 Tax=Trichoderma longibrachiatum ATCC 18648 TaxID=983965 RepID=A0A2T4C655_TRILO|nr:hypothetical protein M440DRAFT_1422071 [Trichoderma longibrachiatum ATCC 18648]